MRILIADTLKASAVSELERLGCDVTVRAELTADDLPPAIQGYQILVVRSTRVTEQTISSSDQLALVVRAGAGVNTIALDAAADAGIYVANCPGKNADAVAELTIGLIISADRGIANATADLRDGRWRKSHYQVAAGLRGRTLGIVGYGSIGKAVAQCALGIGMKVSAWSRSLSEETAETDGISRVAKLVDLARTCDVVTMHLSSNKETKSLIDVDFLNELKDGAVFVNTSRGDVVDEEALKRAIDEKHLRVGLDVFANEPGGGNAEFADTAFASAITATPHIGASTEQASDAIAAETVRVIRAYKETGVPENVVNVNRSSPAPWILVVRHRNRVGVLAGVLDELRGGDINIEEMQNMIFAGGGAACCTMQIDSLPNEEILRRIRSMDSVYAARVETKGGH